MTRTHRTSASADRSLFRASAAARFVVALVLAALLWGAILWATR